MIHDQTAASELVTMVEALVLSACDAPDVAREAALKQRRLVCAVHVAAGRATVRGRFPQDCQEEALPALAGLLNGAEVDTTWYWPHGEPVWPAGLETGWLSYGCEWVLRDSVPGQMSPERQRAARCLGLLARASDEANELWAAAPDRSVLLTPPYLLSAIVATDRELEASLSLGWARWFAPVPDERTLRQMLGGSSALRRLREQLEAWTNELLADAAGEAFHRQLSECMERWRERREQALAAGRLWGFVPHGWDMTRVRGDHARALRIGRTALLEDPRFREAWEVQRWGEWCAEPRIARLFPVGICLLALAGMGEEVGAAAAELLSTERSADGFRYYGRWRGIPPDADDLGLALQLLPLAADTAGLRRSFEWPVELLLRNTEPNGWINTYLEKDLLEPTTADGPDWLRWRCSAVGINALIGLLRADWPLPEGYLARVLERLLVVLRSEGLASATLYPACYVRLLLARLERALESKPCPVSARSTLATILESIERELRVTRRLDGGWGSPMATACHLSVLALRRTRDFDPVPSVLYLCARQEPDGMWAREPFFHGPGVDDAPFDYATRPVTTALCLEALVLAEHTWPPD
jgi:hypothetical protein